MVGTMYTASGQNRFKLGIYLPPPGKPETIIFNEFGAAMLAVRTFCAMHAVCLEALNKANFNTIYD